jgi:3-deoxy-7-phosphoheptulonate synthase
VEALITETRRNIHNIMAGKDDRLLVVIGPCSIHDPPPRWTMPAA